jgi:hypothetical protein
VNSFFYLINSQGNVACQLSCRAVGYTVWPHLNKQCLSLHYLVTDSQYKMSAKSIHLKGVTTGPEVYWRTVRCLRQTQVRYTIIINAGMKQKRYLSTVYYCLMDVETIPHVSHTKHSIIFWRSSSHSVKIFKIQKNIIRIITGCRSRDSCRDLFKNLKILPLQSTILTLQGRTEKIHKTFSQDNIS